MTSNELDALDSAIAWLEGVPTASSGKLGTEARFDRPAYRPTRSPEETLRLMEKYIRKVVRLNDGEWAAVGPSGRASVGPTLAISVCKAVVEPR